jgi:DNA ligase-1
LGNRYFAPDWFTAGLPDVPLDGELWGGRKKFQRTVSIARRQDKSDHWKELTFVVFDAPALDAPFEERLAFCTQHLSAGRAPYARPHEHVQCRGTEHLKTELARVEALGGEGLMLRQPASRYEVGRSSTLLKVKSFHDAEARVIDHLDGEGRHKGRLGALVVELPDGTRFSVGTGFSDAERRNPPPRGSIITFRYQELSDGGVPRFPSYVGIRHDVAFPPPSVARLVAPVARPPAAATPAAATAAATAGSRRHFELVDADSSKFWEIEVAGSEHTVRYGRIGTQGQEKKKAFSDPAAAAAAAAALIAEKLAKGYIES